MDTGTNSPITPAISSTAPTNKTNRRTVTLELLFHSTTTTADIPALNDAKLTNRIHADHGEAWSLNRRDDQCHTTAPWLTRGHENGGAGVKR